MKSSTGQVMNLGSLYGRIAGLSDKRKAKGKRYTLAKITRHMIDFVGKYT